MARVAFAFVMLAGLAACQLFDLSEGAPDTVNLAGLPDPACREVARQRVADGFANGYDRDLHARIARDTYANCVRMQRDRAAVAGPAAAP